VSLLLNLAQVLQDRGELTEVRALAERAVKVHSYFLQITIAVVFDQ
jgi:hypothetical protein